MSRATSCGETIPDERLLLAYSVEKLVAEADFVVAILATRAF